MGGSLSGVTVTLAPTHTTISAADLARMTTVASILDDYNNNR